VEERAMIRIKVHLIQEGDIVEVRQNTIITISHNCESRDIKLKKGQKLIVGEYFHNTSLNKVFRICGEFYTENDFSLRQNPILIPLIEYENVIRFII